LPRFHLLRFRVGTLPVPKERMGKIQKKGEKGAAANYTTRTKAVRKLQLTLAEFRRLCILKGIYPREPKNKRKASGGKNPSSTFYFTKDINFLMHEPVLAKLRERKAFLRKLNKAVGKWQLDVAQSMEARLPQYTLDHLVKER
jgi:pescadillo protein